MTSQKALAPTTAFLADNAYFGLRASQVCLCASVLVRGCACV